MTTEIQSLTQKLGAAMDKFIIAKIQKDRANNEFAIIQREVSYLEDELRQLKWEQITV